MQKYSDNKMIKKTLLCLLLLSCLACQEKKNENIIKLATSPDYPPFEYKKDGEVIGFDMDVAKLIAAELGKELQITEMEFSSLIPALQSGKVDFVISGLTLTPEREKNIDFSNVYYQASIIGLSFPSKEIKSVDDLRGKKIGAQLGSVMENFASEEQKKFKDIKVISLTNNMHLLQELKLGRIDVLLLEEGQVKDFLNQNPELVSITFPKTGSGYAIGFRKDSDLKNQFNEVIAKLKLENIINQLVNKWLR